MKRVLALGLAAVMAFSLFGCSAKNDKSLDQVLKKKAFIMGFDDVSMPMGFKDANGTYIGFDIDLAKEISKRLNVTLNLQIVSAQNASTELVNKTVDYLGNSMTASKEPKSKLTYSKPIFKNSIVLLVLKDSKVNNMNDLKDKKLAVVSGTVASGALDENKSFKKSATVMEVKDANTAISELLNSRVDAIVIDKAFAQYQISKGVNVRMLDKPLKNVNYCMVFRKGDKKLINKVNVLLKDIKNDGTFAGIVKKWFGSDNALK